jgi:hypothetical protein
VTVKALQIALSSGEEAGYNQWDGDHFLTADRCSARAYEEAGIRDPKSEISMMEVHDCFSITELVTMEDLHISERGRAWRDVLDGCYDRDGKVPCQVDGGLKCFGHPIGASGLRMLYEMYLQRRLRLSGIEAALFTGLCERGYRHRDRHDRTRRGQRPGGDANHGRGRRRRGRSQWVQNLYQQRGYLRSGGIGGPRSRHG